MLSKNYNIKNILENTKVSIIHNNEIYGFDAKYSHDDFFEAVSEA